MEWISVKERLPEPNERILAYCPNMTEVDIGPVSVQWGWTCKRKRSDISHWMPLPESPNEFTDYEADVEEYEKMTIEAAIKHCEEVGRRSPCTPCEREHMQLAAWLSELVSLRAQQKRPNEPLTLEELRAMDGEPVWLHTFSTVQKKTNIAQWAILEVISTTDVVLLRGGCNSRLTKRFTDYGKTWFAYRGKPGQEEKEQIHDSD